MSTFNIAANYNNRIIPDYIEAPLENPLKVKTVVYLCDHAGKTQVKETSQPAQKHIRTTKSIKIDCSASIYKHTMTDGTVCIKYSWQHPNHDPFKIEEISLSRLSNELKQWVEGLVSQNMDWKSIKNMFRMSENRLLEAATFHTNNLIESYHNQLKTFYLGRARSL
ncbi:hypothetical protein PHYBLDRAFT_144550 [Phycomyces blakesleeanus NRRL 1555(-)]|uniref:Uncharacterized protein n=1 Tax=Phycomyces blakesleeanus (strain ATCC 8743b / DSM 1359 / FGSC 10004 / NBRC 33097 / NRRL 1555) TaxID=763407 RepID=A0A162U7L6_PHYB8|nr:hypothetical protein PHYBLDRAFT_144550 [Phycomyces blakesleeanus NRRL 1555(-)]OAD74092.1 hypothetical protein PHYBLDRAFT_144550 [Phycomyces blakesleeanus NRRL 1555(-)]|eukprot:XP_018292132.1 hypothetical protein PHYBLDRAFT_144550 [Phycomyces blakesleeanus NRRL 1555(-)]